MEGNESLMMFINSKKEYPNHMKYDMVAKGQLGNGLIKTINKSNANYCIKDGCDYYVTVSSDNISTISFYPSVFPNESILAFKKVLTAIEEVE